MKSLPVSLLATTLGLLLAGHAAGADDKPASAQELAAARAELDRAARRYSELARGQAAEAAGAAAHARTLAADARERAAVARQLHLEHIRNRPVLGVLLAPDEQAGVRITGVTPGGGAAEAGLRSGDRLVSVDGNEVLGSTGALRVENARRLLSGLDAGKPVDIGYLRGARRANARVTPRQDHRIAIIDHASDALVRPDGNVFIERLGDGSWRMNADSIQMEALASLAPEVRRHVADGVDRGVRLLSAFRWNGLNLASVDADLGHYFGTDRGVLVLSSGELEQLRAGDVIQRVDGKAVSSPRDVMDTLRKKSDGDTASIDYLRDRKSGQARITIPKAMAWPPAPPAPPASPAPPPAAPPAAPKAPPAPPRPSPTAALESDGAVWMVQLGAH